MRMQRAVTAGFVAFATLSVLSSQASAQSATTNGQGQADTIHAMAPLGARGASHTGGGGGSTSSPNLIYHGGAVEPNAAVYLVEWGSQWNVTGNDPSGEINYLKAFFAGVGSSEGWSKTTTQYCSAGTSGFTTCPSSSTPITQPASALAGFIPDTGRAAPSHPSQKQLAAEAASIASQLKAEGLNVANAQIVIATAHGATPTGFGSSYCAWHSSTASSASSTGRVGYTNLPYITDAGANCGEGFVNAGNAGLLDGVSIVAGHEYAETVTDLYPNGGWLDSSGAEIGDKCAWISPTKPGGAADITLGGASYAVQSLWSNSATGCAI